MKLYRSTKNKDVSVWEIFFKENQIIIITKSGLNNRPVTHYEKVGSGKAGRTLEQQINLRIDSRIKVKKDQGYVHTIEKAKSSKLMNQLGLPMPMLAERFDKMKKFNPNESFIQRKYDGHRCLIARNGNGLIAYSRRGLEIKTIDHILKNIRMPDGAILDGELYCHGESLQTIASWVKRKQDNTMKLRFYMYDIIIEDTSFNERLEILRQEVDLGKTFGIRVQTTHFSALYSMYYTFNKIKEQGYEGLIIRPSNGVYEIGRRSKSLIKMKSYEDKEFVVFKVTTSRLGWGILHFMSEGGEFKATAPGTNLQRKHVAKYPHLYIGESVTIEYANLTDKRIPFQPIARRWLNEI